MPRVKVLRRRRAPDEYCTARHAIRNHCLECGGYERAEVEGCTAPACWLYPWRLGKTPPELKAARLAPRTTALAV